MGVGTVVLKEMGHVVEDPEDADLYYVDAYFYNSMHAIKSGKVPTISEHFFFQP